MPAAVTHRTSRARQPGRQSFASGLELSADISRGSSTSTPLRIPHPTSPRRSAPGMTSSRSNSPVPTDTRTTRPPTDLPATSTPRLRDRLRHTPLGAPLPPHTMTLSPARQTDPGTDNFNRLLQNLRDAMIEGRLVSMEQHETADGCFVLKLAWQQKKPTK